MRITAFLWVAVACLITSRQTMAELEGPLIVPESVVIGTWSAAADSRWTIYGTDDPSNDLLGVVALPNAVPEYHWWNGCSPTTAGMMFAYWDTYLGKINLYAGDASLWDKVNMNMRNPDNYSDTHQAVASWQHKEAGLEKGLNYGTWDWNNNGRVDDQAQWNSLADFLRTQDGSTYRINVARGLIDYAEWDDPETAETEAYVGNSARTVWDPNWTEYVAEIDSGYPVHVGISGHSILGMGHWTGITPWHTEPTEFVVSWTTWGARWDGKWGLVEFDDVYAYTFLRVGEVVPESSSTLLLLLGLSLVCVRCIRGRPCE